MIERVTFTTVAPETASEIYREVGLHVEVDGEQLTLTNPKGYQRAQECMMNASAIEQNVRVKVAGGTDHGFTGGQQAEYDSLSAKAGTVTTGSAGGTRRTTPRRSPGRSTSTASRSRSEKGERGACPLARFLLRYSYRKGNDERTER